MTTRALALRTSFALCVLLPAALAGQQPDPVLIGEGAQAYSANCARCHNARSSTERSDAAWAVIMGHMRARANLTKAQAAAVLAYLQATNMPEGTGMGPGAGEADEVVLPAEARLLLVPLSRPPTRRPGRASRPRP